MNKYLLIVLLYFVITDVQAQQVKFFCSYEGNIPKGRRGAIIAAIQQQSRQDSILKARIKDLLSPIGVNADIIVRRDDKQDNFCAVVYNNQRYILYNSNFLSKLLDQRHIDWAALGVLAHEIGHHLADDLWNFETLPKEQELEADRWSGFALAKAGATPEEAIMAAETLPEKGDSIHPGRRYRLEAVQRGYREATADDDIEDNVLSAEQEADGKWGYINRSGQLSIPFMYDAARNFFDGRAAVRLDGKWGYINKLNLAITPFKYDVAHDFKEGMALVGIANKFGFISKHGTEDIKLIYEELTYDFQDGFARVIKRTPDGKNTVAGYINKLGTPITDFKYDPNSRSFTEGRASVMLLNKEKWGYIDSRGQEVIQTKYNSALPFMEGRAVVFLNNQYFHIDTKGDTLNKTVYDNALSFYESIATVKLKDKYGFIGLNGKIKIPLTYKYAGTFSEGLCFVADDNWNVGFIDTANHSVIPFEYRNATNFHQGLAGTMQEGLWGFIARDGHWIVKPQFYRVGEYSEGLVAVADSTLRWGFLNMKGRLVVPFKYAIVVRNFQQGYALVLDDHNNRIIIDTKGDEYSE